MRKFETLLLLSPELSAENREGILSALTAVVEREKGVMESNDAEGTIKECMATQAKRVILLADHTKFGKTAFVHSFDFDRINAIVTDEPMTTSWRDFLEKKHVERID